MKSLLQFLVCVLVQLNLVMGQNPTVDKFIEFVPSKQSFESQIVQIHRGIKPSKSIKVQQRNPNSTEERLIGFSVTENNIKKDSFNYFYSNNRGSQTYQDPSATYYIHHAADTVIYYGRERGNFKIGWPNQGLTYNDANNNNIRYTTYYYHNVPYENYINTWDPTESYVMHRNFKRTYIINPNDNDNDNDFYYQGTLYNKDGYGLRDTIILNYSKNDKTLMSNYVWTSLLDLDDKGRYKFQRRQTEKLTTLSIDTNIWEYNAPFDKLSSYVEMTTTTDLKTSEITTYKKTELLSYNLDGLIDTIKILINDIPMQLIAYKYNIYGHKTNIDYYDFVDDKLQPNSKIENYYVEDYQTVYSYHEWDNFYEDYVETERLEVTLDENKNWDTTRVYFNQILSYMLVHTFTPMNNIKTITRYENDKITKIDNYFYETYETTSTAESANNLEVNVYPNPLSNELQVLINDENNEEYSINILNISGKTVAHFWTNSAENVLPLGQLPQGMYLMQISNKDKSRTMIQKIIKI